MKNNTNRQELENKLNQNLGGGFATHGYYSSPRFEVEATANGFKAYIGNRGIAISKAAEEAAKELGYKLEYNKEESDSFSTTYNFTK